MFASNLFSDKFSYENIYPTTHDAVLTILRRNKTSKILLRSKKNQSFYINLIETANNANNEAINSASPISPNSNVNLAIEEEDNEILPKYIHRNKSSNLFDEIAMKITPKVNFD